MPVLHFQNAVMEHTEWWNRFEHFLHTGENASGHNLEADDIARDDLCAIGHWLHGDGMRFAEHSVYQEVKYLHKEMHVLAGRAWHAKADGDHDLLSSLITDIKKIRHEMFMAWADLNTIVGAYE